MADFEGEVKAAIGDYEEEYIDEDMDDEDIHKYGKGAKGKGKEKGKGKGSKGMDYMDDYSDDERAQIESQLDWGGGEVIPDDVNAKEWGKSAHNSSTVLTGIKDIDASVAAIDRNDEDYTHDTQGAQPRPPGRGKGTPKQFEMAHQQQLREQKKNASKKTSVPPSGGYQKGKGGKKSKRKTKKRKSKSKKKRKTRSKKRKTRSKRK